jgi:hypothetical protein
MIHHPHLFAIAAVGLVLLLAGSGDPDTPPLVTANRSDAGLLADVGLVLGYTEQLPGEIGIREAEVAAVIITSGDDMSIHTAEDELG